MRCYNFHILKRECLNIFKQKRYNWLLNFQRNIKDIEDFIKLSTEEQKSLLKNLPEIQFEEVIRISHTFPRVMVLNHEFKVLGESAIIPNAIVTLCVKLVASYGPEPKFDSFDRSIPLEEDKKITWWEKPKIGKPAYAPFYPSKKTPVYYVGLANAPIGRLITINKATDIDTPKIVRLQFQAPPNSGTWTFQIVVKSDTFIGIDQYIDVVLKVHPDSASPLEEIEDDISEPDDVIHLPDEPKPKRRQERGEFDDSDDSEFFEEQESPEMDPDFVE